MKSIKKRSKKSPPPDVYVAMTYTFFITNRNASEAALHDDMHEAIRDEIDSNGCTVYTKIDASKLYSLDHIVLVDEDNVHVSVAKPALENVLPWNYRCSSDYNGVNVFELLSQSVDYDADDGQVDVQAPASELETCHRLMKKFGYKRVKAKK